MKKRILKPINALLAGVISMLGFQSCDKDDDNDRENMCMYGPAPSSYQAVDQDELQASDSVNITASESEQEK